MFLSQRARADQDAKRLKETQETWKNVDVAVREQDNKVFWYATELLKEAKAEGRPTLPIEKALHVSHSDFNSLEVPNQKGNNYSTLTNKSN